jgi:thiol-disulfide isomerase/thioredoxin
VPTTLNDRPDPRRRLLLGAAALALAAPAAAQFTDPKLTHSLTELKPPKPAPDFTLKDMDGKPHSLKDYRGRVLLVNFWATWCPPCRREMPSMERLQQHFKGKSFSVLAINQQEDADRIFEFTGALRPAPSFPILLDGDTKVATAYGVKGLPVSFVLDGQGRITHRAIGGREFDHPELIATLAALLKPA